MYSKYKTLTKLTAEEIQKVNKPKSAHIYGDAWRMWAWGVGEELDNMDEASAKKVLDSLKNQYQVLEQEQKKKIVQKLVTEESEELFRLTGIIYVPNECEYLTEGALKPYMNRVTILHMHKNVKFIDGQALKKCRKLEKVDFGFVEGVYNPHYFADGKRVIDRKTKEKLWP